MKYIRQNSKISDNSNHKIQIFNEQEVLGKQFRIYGTIDEPLFLAKDVAEWIEHSNSRMMLQSIDDDEKLCVNNPYALKGQREQWFLTEDGLYEVLMQSRKPIAKQFKKKVKEILKSIRRHGVYMTSGTIEKVLDNPDIIIQLATALKEERERYKTEIQKERDYSFSLHLTISNQINALYRAQEKAQRYEQEARKYLSIAAGMRQLLKENNIRVPGNLLLYSNDYKFLNEKNYQPETSGKNKGKTKK